MVEWNFLAVMSDADLLLAGTGEHAEGDGPGAACSASHSGCSLALTRLFDHSSRSRPSAAFIIEFFRTTPPLVQLFWFFFALPILIDVRMTPFIAAIVTFSIQSSAFFAEVFRGGILSIDKGQWEGAKAIGMDYLPVAAPDHPAPGGEAHDPGLHGALHRAAQDHDLVSTVAYTDLMFQANDLAQKTFRPLEVYTVVAVIYFVMIFAFSQMSIAVEHRLARSGESTVRIDLPCSTFGISTRSSSSRRGRANWPVLWVGLKGTVFIFLVTVIARAWAAV